MWRDSSINTMTIHYQTHTTKNLIWISDIHLDEVHDDVKRRFLDKLTNARCDAVLLTGDISSSEYLVAHLTELSHACGSTPCFFVPGNHDYFGSSFAVVDQAIVDLCARHRNLIALGHGEIIKLSRNTALIGHRGWYDGQAGSGAQTKVKSSDRHLINDFRNLDSGRYFEKLRMLGNESAAYFRRVLPMALTRYSTVLVGTHVPIFTQVLRHGGRYCELARQPYFSNRAAGNAIVGISRNFSDRQIVVYAGHSHCFAEFSLSSTLEIRVAGAQRGFPTFQPMITID